MATKKKAAPKKAVKKPVKKTAAKKSAPKTKKVVAKKAKGLFDFALLQDNMEDFNELDIPNKFKTIPARGDVLINGEESFVVAQVQHDLATGRTLVIIADNAALMPKDQTTSTPAEDKSHIVDIGNNTLNASSTIEDLEENDFEDEDEEELTEGESNLTEANH